MGDTAHGAHSVKWNQANIIRQQAQQQERKIKINHGSDVKKNKITTTATNTSEKISKTTTKQQTLFFWVTKWVTTVAAVGAGALNIAVVVIARVYGSAPVQQSPWLHNITTCSVATVQTSSDSVSLTVKQPASHTAIQPNDLTSVLPYICINIGSKLRRDKCMNSMDWNQTERNICVHPDSQQLFILHLFFLPWCSAVWRRRLLSIRFPLIPIAVCTRTHLH